MEQQHTQLTHSLVKISLLQRCPRCAAGKLYAKGLAVVPSCSHCGLSLKDHDAGDGPAFFVMFFISVLVVPLALWLDSAYSPSLWIQFIIWIPFVIIGSVGLLRVCKACLIALEYKHRLLKGQQDE